MLHQQLLTSELTSALVGLSPPQGQRSGPPHSQHAFVQVGQWAGHTPFTEMVALHLCCSEDGCISRSQQVDAEKTTGPSWKNCIAGTFAAGLHTGCVCVCVCGEVGSVNSTLTHKKKRKKKKAGTQTHAELSAVSGSCRGMRTTMAGQVELRLNCSSRPGVSWIHSSL